MTTVTEARGSATVVKVEIPAAYFDAFFGAAINLYVLRAEVIDRDWPDGFDTLMEVGDLLEQTDWSAEPRTLTVEAEAELLADLLNDALATVAEPLRHITSTAVHDRPDLDAITTTNREIRELHTIRGRLEGQVWKQLAEEQKQRDGDA